MDKIIFFHMNQLGDVLFSLPVLEAARKNWKDKKIVSYARATLAPLLIASGLVDEVITKENNIFAKIGRFKKIASEKFSKAFLFSESPETFFLAFLCGIPERIGFKGSILDIFLTQKIVRTGVPSLFNNSKLAAAAGLTDIVKDYAGLVRVPKIEIERIDFWLKEMKANLSRVVVISPGASSRRPEKRWEKEKWEKIVVLLLNEGYTPVLTGSPMEKKYLEEIAGKYVPKALIFADFGIMGLGALITRANFFVGIDSGAMHLAAGLNVPVFALFGPTDPAQIGPQPLEKHNIIKKDKISDIQPEEVWKKIKERYA